MKRRLEQHRTLMTSPSGQKASRQRATLHTRSLLNPKQKKSPKSGSLYDKARQYALKLLSYRGRSVRELQERLKMRGFPEHVASSAINHLQHTGLINDLALADDLKRKRRLYALLLRKGYSYETIKVVLKENNLKED